MHEREYRPDLDMEEDDETTLEAEEARARELGEEGDNAHELNDLANESEMPIEVNFTSSPSIYK